jgi:photosystem II stability/assembly factor-like uncharacterized protein
MRIKLLLLLTLFFAFKSYSQKVIDIIKFDTSRNYKSIVDKGENEIKKVGDKRGNGSKQFERWKWKYHYLLDDNGNILPENYDQIQYNNYLSSTESNINTFEWEEMGPKSWNRTSSWNPGIGRITSIAFHPFNNLIYITSPGGGLWKSVDNGSTWTPLTDNYNNLQDLYSVAIDPYNENTILIGTGSGAIYRSIDGGLTWTFVSNIGTRCSKIIFHPSNSNILFATGRGVFRSLNNGQTWSRVAVTYTNTSINSMEDVEFHPTNPNIIYSSSPFNPSFIRSEDGGNTWEIITNGITNSARSLIGISPNAPDRVYLVQANGNTFGRLYVSNDAGKSFITSVIGSSSTCTNYFGYETSGCGTGGQAGYDMAISVNPNNADELYIGGINIWKSTNGGISFTALTQWNYPTVNYGYVHADIHVLKFSKGILYTGTDGGIFKQNLNGTWSDLSTGLGIRQFYRISAKNNLLLGGSQDNGTSFYTDKWYDWLGADGMDNIIINSTNFIGSTQYGQFYKTSNGGLTYNSITKPSGGEWVTPIIYQSGRLYAGWNGVYVSDDMGTTWQKLPLTIDLYIRDLEVQNSTIYASRSTTLYISKDDGLTWTSYSFPSTINKIVASPENPNDVYVALNSTTNRVFKSNDGGLTFIDISNGLPNIVTRTLKLYKDTLYAGLNVGAYRYTNDIGWMNITNNLTYSSINDIEIDNGYLYVGTYGRGIWRTKISNSINTDTIVNPVKLYLDSLTLSGSRNNKNVHSLSWSSITNDSLVSVNLQQSISNNSAYTTIFSSKNLIGNYSISTLSGQTYYYRTHVVTKNFSKFSNEVVIKNAQSKRPKSSVIVVNNSIRNLDNTQTISIRNLAGQLLYRDIISPYKVVNLNNLNLGKGIYILQLNESVYKINIF